MYSQRSTSVIGASAKVSPFNKVSSKTDSHSSSHKQYHDLFLINSRAYFRRQGKRTPITGMESFKREAENTAYFGSACSSKNNLMEFISITLLSKSNNIPFYTERKNSLRIFLYPKQKKPTKQTNIIKKECTFESCIIKLF